MPRSLSVCLFGGGLDGNYRRKTAKTRGVGAPTEICLQESPGSHTDRIRRLMLFLLSFLFIFKGSNKAS